METNETISRRSRLASLCIDYAHAANSYLLTGKHEDQLRNLENLIADAAIPLSFMNDLNRMKEAEHADTN